MHASAAAPSRSSVARTRGRNGSSRKVGALLRLARITVLIFGFIPITLASYWVLGFWTLTQVWHVFSLDKSDTAWWAHVGGLAAGAILIVVMRPPGIPLFQCFSPEDAIALAESRSSGPWGRPQ